MSRSIFSYDGYHKKFDKLKQRIQLLHEPVTSYTDDIIDLCRDSDSEMSDSTIIQHMMSGINPEFRKKKLSRHSSCMNFLTELLKQAKIEQDLYDTFTKTDQSITEIKAQISPYHLLNPVVATTIKQSIKKQHYTQQNNLGQNPLRRRNSVYQHQPEARTPKDRTWKFYKQNSYTKTKQINHHITQYSKYSCLICGRNNHRTIDCFYKEENGCFKCGEDHYFRHCPMLQNFQ